MKKLALISTFCNTQEKIDILKTNLLKLKKLNVDTLILTPFNLLPNEIINLSTHCIITNENPILDLNVKSLLIYSKPTSKHKIKLTLVEKDYGWASLNQIKRLFSYGSDLEYDIFYQMIYDLDITSEIENIINSNIINFFFGNNRKKYKKSSKGGAHYRVGGVFGIFDKENCKLIESKIRLKKYLKCKFAEELYGKIQKKTNLPVHDYVTTDLIFNSDEDLLNISPTNKLSLFIDNTYNKRNPIKHEVGVYFFNIKKPCKVIIGNENIIIDKEQIVFTSKPTITVDGHVVDTVFDNHPLREIKINDNNDWNYIKNYEFN
tara:strand:+ start:5232 stop:6188 length:957 start_codon:yes stop_codon:yes gene_type:complete